MLHRGEKPERVKVPDFADLLPEGIRRFTTKGVYDAEETQHLSFLQGSGHGGSHPHLAHEFISSIVEERSPLPDAATSANWTMTGICAHISAMKGGERIKIPAVLNAAALATSFGDRIRAGQALGPAAMSPRKTATVPARRLALKLNLNQSRATVVGRATLRPERALPSAALRTTRS